MSACLRQQARSHLKLAKATFVYHYSSVEKADNFQACKEIRNHFGHSIGYTTIFQSRNGKLQPCLSKHSSSVRMIELEKHLKNQELNKFRRMLHLLCPMPTAGGRQLKIAQELQSSLASVDKQKRLMRNKKHRLLSTSLNCVMISSR